MNNLYEAVIILGRSVEDIDQWGWVCGMLGASHGPKCVNGVVTMSSRYGAPVYLQDAADAMPELEMPLRIVAKALIETAPEDAVNEFLPEWKEDLECEDAVEAFEKPLTADLGNVSDVLVSINDADDHHCRPLLTRETARAWFQRAFDKLAAELPEPIPAKSMLVGTTVWNGTDENGESLGYRIEYAEESALV